MNILKRLPYLTFLLTIVVLLVTYSMSKYNESKLLKPTLTSFLLNVCVKGSPIKTGCAIPLTENFAVMSLHQCKGINPDKLFLESPKGDIFEVKIIGIFPELDLAVLESESRFKSFPKIGNSDKMEAGDAVYAMGFNHVFSRYPIVTHGIFSGRTTENISHIIPITCSAVMSDARTNTGFSGGALLNANDGGFIGMISGRFFPYPSESSMGLYAIPSNLIARALKSKNKRTFFFTLMQFEIISKTEDNPFAFALALDDFAGMLQKDDIITSVDGYNFISEGDFLFLLSTASIHADFSILRNGRQQTVRIHLN